jgi:5'-nucleotidase
LSISSSRRARWAAASVTVLALGVAPLAAVGGASAAPAGGAVTTSSDAAGSATEAASNAASRSVSKAAKRRLDLQLLAINDFHGQLEVVPSTSSSGRIATGPETADFTPAGGVAYLARHLKQLRREARTTGAETLTVAAGDLIGATPLLSAAFHDEPTIEAMNAIGLDLASVGNHEFDEGWRELRRMQRGGCLADGDGENNQNSCPEAGRPFKGADFQYLAANVVRESSGRTLFPGYSIQRFGEGKQRVKVGFIGMTLQDTPSIVTRSGVAGLRFTDEVRTVRRLMPTLRKKGVKSVVVLLHQGAVPNPGYLYDECPGISGAGLEIAEQLPAAVDVVVSGHTHQPYNCTVDDPKGNPRLLTSASSVGRMITEINLRIDRRTKDVIRPKARAENHIVTNDPSVTSPVQGLLDLINRYKRLVEPIANQVLGRIAPAGEQNSLDKPSTVTEDFELGNLIADSQLAFDRAVPEGGEAPEIAFMNPGGIRTALQENAAGEVTYGAAFAVQPFNNFVSSQTLTGAQIHAVLNEQWNGANQARPNILQVAGLTYSYDASIAADPADLDAVVPGTLMVDRDLDGTGDEPVVPTEAYRVVLNNFIADGGDNFPTFTQGTDRFIGGLDIDALADHLAASSPYAPTPTSRITVVE